MIIEQLFIVTAALGLVMILLNVIGASIYDLREVRKQRQLKLHPYSRQHRPRPLVSVIVTTRDDAKVIERCLSSLASSSYRKLEIIVIDNASQDNTKQLVKEFQARHPKKHVRLVARRAASNSLKATLTNVKKYAEGSLILRLDAASMLDKQAVANAVKHFNMEPDISVLTLNRRVVSAFSTVGLFQKYPELLRSRSKKFASVFNLSSNTAPEAAIYRRDMLFASHRPAARTALRKGSLQPRPYYASDVIAYTEPLTSLYEIIKRQYRQQLNAVAALRQQSGRTNGLAWLRLSFALCTGILALSVPLLLSYFIYMAVGLHEPALLFASGGLLSMLLLAAIWGEEHLALRQKFTYILGIPITYGLFYLLSLSTLLVIFGAAFQQSHKFLRTHFTASS